MSDMMTDETEHQWLERMARSNAELWSEITAGWNGHGAPSAVDATMAADHALAAAGARQLLGFEAQDVREWLVRAASAFQLLFSAPPEPGILVRQFAAGREIEPQAPAVDASLTSPERARLAIELAVIADADRAEPIATVIETSMRRLGEDSADAALARAIGAITRGRDAVAYLEANAAEALGAEPGEVAGIRALVERSPAMLREALKAVLMDQAERSRSEEMQRDPRRGVPLTALTLAALGRQRGIEVQPLAGLPLDLLAEGQSS